MQYKFPHTQHGRGCWIFDQQLDQASIATVGINTGADNSGILSHSPLSTPNSHHLFLIHQLNGFVNSSLQQIMDMHSEDQAYEGDTNNQEDEQMEDQVVPDLQAGAQTVQAGTQTEPMMENHQHNQRGEEPSTLDPLTQTLYLRKPLTLDMSPNIGKKFIIKIPKEVEKTDINIRCYSSQDMCKYVTILVPTLKKTQGKILENPPTKNHLVNLEMTMLPGGSTNTQEKHLMKILLWNCRGARSVNFMNNLRALIETHNPTVLALVETRMEDHNNLLQALDFTDVIQAPAKGFSGGLAMFWKSSEISLEPFVITDQEIHATLEISPATAEGPSVNAYSEGG